MIYHQSHHNPMIIPLFTVFHSYLHSYLVVRTYFGIVFFLVGRALAKPRNLHTDAPFFTSDVRPGCVRIWCPDAWSAEKSGCVMGQSEYNSPQRCFLKKGLAIDINWSWSRKNMKSHDISWYIHCNLCPFFMIFPRMGAVCSSLDGGDSSDSSWGGRSEESHLRCTWQLVLCWPETQWFSYDFLWFSMVFQWFSYDFTNGQFDEDWFS